MKPTLEDHAQGRLHAEITLVHYGAGVLYQRVLYQRLHQGPYHVQSLREAIAEALARVSLDRF